MPRFDDALQAWLERFLATHAGAAGTVHVRKGELLEIAAAVNIPPKVVEVTATIPKGRGMAGLAWERDKPVSTCNLATDGTGDVRPGAKAVDAKAAAALPVHDRGGELFAVVGIAWPDERDVDDATLAAITRAASDLPGAG
ncbi:MAG TPA: GAF domain-containing protein [Nannocystaceae bacterium]|nr:GAF domain-containing protein [Nannocystaceae bacterium]